MVLLGIDTATTVAAAGVVQGGPEIRILSDVGETSATGHAARLPEIVARALAEAGRRLDEIDAVAVSVGPGSFTGLRVGLSFAKGIVFASRARLVGVSTLEALASLAPPAYGTIAVVSDARRGETYAALFRRTGGVLERITKDLALSPDGAAERVLGLVEPGNTVLLGDASSRYLEAFAGLPAAGISVVPLERISPRGSAVARLGADRLARGESDPVDSLVPVYVRASAAEENLRPSTLTTENRLS